MISEFRLQNFGPFKDEIVLDFRATKLKDTSENLIQTPDGKLTVSSIAIFGSNASGKSCVVNALGLLSNLMRFPLPVNVPMPYNPFRLSPETKTAPTSMGVHFYHDNVLYDYNLSYTAQEVISESLYYYPNERRTKVFTRNGSKFSCSTGGSKVKLKNLTGMVGRNSTFLSVAAQFNHEVCRGVAEAMSLVTVLSGDMNTLLNSTVAEMERDPEFKSLVVEAMLVADFGIDDLNGSVREMKVSELEGTVPPQIIGFMMATGSQKINQLQLSMSHKVSTEGVTDTDRTFPYVMESSGTIRMICIMGPVISTLRSGGVLAIDEFGSYLDNDLCRWIVELFSGNRNKRGAQLIFNTHNQLLMDTDSLLRRDQIYITTKNRTNQVAELYSLADFNIRKSYDPRKGFTLGKFGGRPLIIDEGWLNLE